MNRAQRHKPRADIIAAVRNKDTKFCLLRTAELHGHYCPGSALGVMASVFGLNLLSEGDIPSDGLENLMAIVEVNACFADGVQVVSGCTLGNNALVYRDLGKHAVTFALRDNGKAVRVRVRADFRSCIDRLAPQFYPLLDKVIRNRVGSQADRDLFKEQAREAAFALMNVAFEDILIAKTTHPGLPDYAPIVDSAVCPNCHEQVMATKVVPEGEHMGLCLVCAGRTYSQVEGSGIVSATDNSSVTKPNAPDNAKPNGDGVES